MTKSENESGAQRGGARATALLALLLLARDDNGGGQIEGDVLDGATPTVAQPQPTHAGVGARDAAAEREMLASLGYLDESTEPAPPSRSVISAERERCFLGGHPKTGQSRTPERRPVERVLETG